MIVYIKDPKIPIKELLQFINTFTKVSEYRIDSKKSVVLLYTDEKYAEKECKEK